MKKVHPVHFYSGLFVAFDFALLWALVSMGRYCDFRFYAVLFALSVLIPLTIHLWIVSPEEWDNDCSGENIWIRKLIGVTFINIVIFSVFLSIVYWIAGVLFFLSSIAAIRHLGNATLGGVLQLACISCRSLLYPFPKDDEENETKPPDA